ncbi:MAG: HAD superfamily hydrolase (TIGR01509 family) [Cognaticolwellia sp.]|jgi:HAD superfamily hydrolase (TIGR01509 family)
MNIKTVIFDMDGVLIDSEPFWRQAQIEELSKYKVKITIDDCINYTMGRKLDDLADTWCKRFDLPISNIELQQNIMHSVISHIREQGQAKAGLYSLLNYLKKNNFNIGLATSSSVPVINAVLDHLSIRDFFTVICSADNEKYGKPHPDVYLSAMTQLKSNKEQCIIIEDSVTGMISGKAAAITTYVIPEDITEPKFSIADGIFTSLEEIEHYLINKAQPSVIANNV